MNIYATGSFCDLYKCAGIGIHSDTEFKSEELRPDILHQCPSSNIADANALFYTLSLILHFDKRTWRLNKKVNVYVSDIAVVKRFLKELDIMYLANYYRPDPWNKMSQLLRYLQDHGLLKRIRVLHCDRDEPIMKLAIKQAKGNLKAARKYVISLHEKDEDTKQPVQATD
jgi:hypothetical protein